MKFGRADYQDRFTDQADLIPDKEPVFLLRGQDTAAGEAVRIWADIHEAQGGDPKVAEQAREWAKEMDAWAENNGKTADFPENE